MIEKKLTETKWTGVVLAITGNPTDDFWNLSGARWPWSLQKQSISVWSVLELDNKKMKDK